MRNCGWGPLYERPQLSTTHSCAAAELLDVLAMGEDSAVLTFESMAESCNTAELNAVLKGIASDESRHQLWLARLKQVLPETIPDVALRRLLRRFFSRLADRDMQVHLVRVLALDSAVCRVLGAIRSPGTPLSQDAMTNSVLRRIHRDEARHVAIAKRCAAPLVDTARGKELMAEVREGLAHVLAFRATAFDALQVDPDRLFARLRRLPREGAGT